MYDYCLGGKDNFAVDREAVLAVNKNFPEGVDVARQNRLFLYRVVRFLAQEAGIDQFLDLGSGLPTQHNVHQVAQQFQPGAHVVYVDNDPIVLAHGRALLADNDATTVITADLTEPREILARPDVAQLIDFTRPVAALFLSVPHSIPDDHTLRDTLSTVTRALTPGSFVALSQAAGVDEEAAQENTELATSLGLAWKTRTVAEFTALVAELGLEPVEPGLIDVNDWRPDPDQPPLAPVDAPLRPYVGAVTGAKRVMELGGVLRKP
ncbi:SAM-dependent methyltransferase [Salinactinospora qingdaonensis]|uniref:SAM-dependent methyltransferase n=2 Tax=Salinactinospora qingdaonensis TaxID=702744 RepID=A0ABP7GGC7_9ACTN